MIKRSSSEKVADYLNIDGEGGWSYEDCVTIAKHCTTSHLEEVIIDKHKCYISEWKKAVQQELEERALFERNEPIPLPPLPDDKKETRR